MTRLLLLSVQSIFKNLNKIRGKVLHLSEQSLDAFNEPRESFIELWGYSQEQCKEVTHTSEGKLTEQRRSMRRLGGECRQFALGPQVIGIECGNAAVKFDS